MQDPESSETVPDAAGDSQNAGRSGGAGAVETIGRFQVVRTLGRGAFGVVYHGYDPELDREVAVKLLPPLPPAIRGADEDDPRLDEARALGRLDHPNIVPIFDAGTLPSGELFIVSKLIEGHPLAQVIRSEDGDSIRAAGLLADVCDALHHAHQERIYHRDIKPANILVDTEGHPFLIDFGIALLNERFGDPRRFRRAGTPHYMSPEQARGEGHLVDGRTDVWAVGVIFYEWLTGKRPFEAPNEQEILDRVIRVDPPPVRQLRCSIDPELERIVMRALAKRPSQRHGSAQDLASDLRNWREAHTLSLTLSPPAAVTPRGLQSFSEADAKFFLELLPGPRDRQGLPISVRFWKEGIEETTPGSAFRTGLLYGPSGSGKSSFVQAALLPHLSTGIRVVFVEAAGGATEERLRSAFRRLMPTLPDSATLSNFLRAARERTADFGGTKLLLVIDQLEQWLHSDWIDRGPCELIDALRQCDGHTVQAVLIVRDDFWLAATLFMNELEVELHTASNCAAVEAFDLAHAEQVLIKIGRAYGRLPGDPNPLNEEENAFVSEAVRQLGVNSTVEPVLLSVFAELFKARPWDPRQLKDLGGAAGLGVRFLDESLQGRRANPALRRNLAAVEKILAALLPPAGSSLKCRARSEAELMELSGLASSQESFRSIMRSLDRDLRILAPAESPQSNQGREYQLTHDYLVLALRDWLDRRSLATRSGRVRTQLRQVTELWSSSKRKSRFLPTAWEWLLFLIHTRRGNRSETEQSLMRASSRRHLQRIALGATAAALLALAAWSAHGFYRGRVHSHNILQSSAAQLPLRVDASRPYGFWVNRFLEQSLNSSSDSRQDRNARYALLDHEPLVHAPKLLQHVLEAEDPASMRVLGRALVPHAAACLETDMENLAASFAAGDGRLEERVRTALVLADIVPDHRSWHEHLHLQRLAEHLLDSRLSGRGVWARHFQEFRRSLDPEARKTLDEPLERAFQGVLPPRAQDPHAVAASIVLSEFLIDDLNALLRLLDNARLDQLAPLTNRLAEETGFHTGLIDRLKTRAAPSNNTQPLILSNAILALFTLGSIEEAWKAVETTCDPAAFARLHIGFRDIGASPSLLAKEILRPDWLIERNPWFDLRHLDSTGVRTAPAPDRRLHIALLALAEWSWQDLEGFPRDAWRTRVEELWRTRPEGRLHSAAHCVLQNWNLLPSNAPPSRPLPAERSLREGEWFASSNAHVLIAVQPLSGPGSEPLPLVGIAAMETTNAQFNILGKRSPQSAQAIAGRFDGSSYPVVFLTYREMADYLAQLDPWDPRYRLCFEREWLAACLGQLPDATYCGNDPAGLLLLRHEWLAENAASKTQPAGLRKPNPLGFFDILGNCAEVTFPDSDTAGSTDTFHIAGRYFGVEAAAVTAHDRPSMASGVRENWVSFRVACDVAPDSQTDGTR